MWKIILSYWYGNEKLWKAFWIVGWGGCFFIGAASWATRLCFPTRPTPRWEAVLSLIIAITIIVWITVSVWRCAPNTTSKIWCWAARVIAILYVSPIAVAIIATTIFIVTFRDSAVSENVDILNEAIESDKQAIRINPDDAYAHFMLGLSFLDLNDNNSALEQYKILKKLDPEKANELFDLIYK
jgi:tetratricopeptide (TPR) repeat protein